MSRAIHFAALCCLACCLSASRAQDTLVLELERAVRLNGGGVYNLSGMAYGADGYLYFTDDNGPAPIDWAPQNGVFLRIKAAEVLDPVNETPMLEVLAVAGGDSAYAALAQESGKAFKFDLEGVAMVGNGRLWACDERDRMLLEYDNSMRTLRQVAGYGELAKFDERLAAGRVNNGFEGIAMLGDKLFLANEMFPNLIVRYTMGHEDSLVPDTIFGIEGSSDICGLEAADGKLYALGRTGSTVYKLDPASGKVMARASFGREADNPEYRFRQRMDYFRNSEGLAVGGGRIFIVLDGNFQSGIADGNERRPLLLIYKQPAGF